ncbi:MAG: 4-alpha-glucanotransferase, partial [Acidimicrobiales bacterium]
MLRSLLSPTADDDLIELARLHGVQTSYVDVDGERRVAGLETLAAVLGSLGVGTGDLAGSLREERLRRHREVLSPVIASPPMVPQVVEVALPRAAHPRDCWLTIESEGGNVHRSRLMPAVHRPVGGANVEGVGMDRYEVRIAPSVAAVLSPGYYQLRVEGPGVDATSLVVVPPRCPEPARSWGTFLPVHSIRPVEDWGIGTYPALGELAGWTAELGGEFVGTLPLFPMLDPADPSPYLPATRLAWNELYVDPTALPEAEAVPEAGELLGSAAGRALGSALVDYPATAALVRQALEPMAEALWTTPSSRRDELEHFARSRPEIAAYARFRGEREGEGP